MADWTDPPIDTWEKPPGGINPPPPDQIQPTDPGWSAWVRKETDRSGLKWTHTCSVSLEVTATGATRERAIDGDNPTDYSADKDWGWKEDRVYETTPPEPYQDFTRWVRHYPNLRRQKCVQYKAQVFVRCGTTLVAVSPSFFWVTEGQPTAGPADVYDWTRTSGMETDAAGHAYKWQKTGKKQPPIWQRPEPGASVDLSHPESTPPPLLVHPLPEYKFGWDHGLKLGLDPGYKFGWEHGDKFGYDWFGKPPPAWPFDPGAKTFKWFRIGDVFDKEEPKPKKDK